MLDASRRAYPQMALGGASVGAPIPQQSMIVKAGVDFHEQPVNQNADGLRIISLGCYCGPKLSLRALGRDEATLPFDWVRTRIDGLLHFMRNDFDKFFHYDTQERVPGAGVNKPMIMYRSYYHSFWHDDLKDNATFEKYRRRMERFKAIDARSKSVLFVRTVATSDELEHIDTLYDELMQRFGRGSKLLVIVDFQPEDEMVVVTGRENLLIAKLHHRAHAADNGGAPYIKPISAAIEWAKTGSAPGATVSPSVRAVQVNPTTWGYMGLGGLDAFEKVPKGGMVPLSSSACGVNGIASSPTAPVSSASEPSQGMAYLNANGLAPQAATCRSAGPVSQLMAADSIPAMRAGTTRFSNPGLAPTTSPIAVAPVGVATAPASVANSAPAYGVMASGLYTAEGLLAACGGGPATPGGVSYLNSSPAIATAAIASTAVVESLPTGYSRAATPATPVAPALCGSAGPSVYSGSTLSSLSAYSGTTSISSNSYAFSPASGSYAVAAGTPVGVGTQRLPASRYVGVM